jgi:hypothetical protein
VVGSFDSTMHGGEFLACEKIHIMLSSPTAMWRRMGDLDPPPWAHSPCLITRPHRAESASQAPPPIGDHDEGK